MMLLLIINVQDSDVVRADYWLLMYKPYTVGFWYFISCATDNMAFTVYKV